MSEPWSASSECLQNQRPTIIISTWRRQSSQFRRLKALKKVLQGCRAHGKAASIQAGERQRLLSKVRTSIPAMQWHVDHALVRQFRARNCYNVNPIEMQHNLYPSDFKSVPYRAHNRVYDEVTRRTSTLVSSRMRLTHVFQSERRFQPILFENQRFNSWEQGVRKKLWDSPLRMEVLLQ